MSVTAVREHPVIFSAPMVRAILDGRKTQTRRVVKPQPQWATSVSLGMYSPEPEDPRVPRKWRAYFRNYETGADWLARCPFGQPGDRLWVRESFGLAAIQAPSAGNSYAGDADPLYPYNDPIPKERHENLSVCYRTDDPWPDPACYWSPIHMPRWASRLTLELTEVRVQRLQEISEEDAKAEGVDGVLDLMAALKNCLQGTNETTQTYRGAFAKLWNSLNAKRYPWQANPWVWALSFGGIARLRALKHQPRSA